MRAFYLKIVAFIMSVIAFLFPWANIDRTDADLTVELASNATTGYSWSYEIEDTSVLELTGSIYKEKPNPTNMTGVGGTEYFYFAAVGEGETDITFTYSQQWEGGNVGETTVYTVTVDENMNVTYTIN